jgi:preprotein translocase subunit SecE
MAKFSIVSYLKEVNNEWMHKVSWPTWSELQNSAIVVSVASLLIAIVVYMMDVTFSTFLQRFYGLF